MALDDVIDRRFARDEFYRNHTEFHYNCPQSDQERGLNVIEMFVKNSRGIEVFIKSWVPIEGTRQLLGLVFLCPGYGDSITFYFEALARTFALAGYGVHGMDYPGFGMSEGLHGYIPNFNDLVDDVAYQYRKIIDRAEFRSLPRFLFGESMGGAVALLAHLKDPTVWDGAVLVAPMCKIHAKMYPPWIIVQLLTALAKIIPKGKLVNTHDVTAIGFRDPCKRKLAYLQPLAYTENPRLGTALQLLRASDLIESKMPEVSWPMMIMQGGRDCVNDPSSSILLHERAKSTDKTLRIYEDSWHCILQGEPDDRVHSAMRDIILWLDARAASKAGFHLSSDSGEFEARVAGAVPSLIKFGKFSAPSHAS
ncbi:caffeoylshikimate esterase [Physcomitrium patens]|uniref:Serine aminopeptidase S33 domain-containing protein n=1 Tax=Physcomitrium patens TaxID=3218 RepID=A0A7I4EIM2_PHYPA|nr:caffeoylshikimate esterase-like isoform X1 [Physcomitrium patens]XP_024384350.1 caffeoylshikimate esterase-like isoform X1 [Physcomitrium patens]|eukprot:XP_024384349.1 caffeoylshikimate esterase-like isoform X1 [Physcomitrella patens]